MAPPAYQPITAADSSAAWRSPDGGNVRVIAGEYEGARGPARTFTPITMLDVRLARRRASSRSTLPRDLQRARRRRQGARRGRASESARAGELILFANDGDAPGARRRPTEETPRRRCWPASRIDEPIVQYGPFVMNTIDEIRQAIADVQTGKFGPVPE